MVRQAHATAGGASCTACRPSGWRATASAVSAVEFALILPVMLTLYIGGIQVSEALSINRKVSHVTSTLADLVTQAKSITNTNMIEHLRRLGLGDGPLFGDAAEDHRVGDLHRRQRQGEGGVERRAATRPPMRRTPCVQLPAAIAVPNSYVVAAEAHYPYTPAIGYVLTGSFDLNSTYYLRPRLSRLHLAFVGLHLPLSRVAGGSRSHLAAAGATSPSITA